MRSSALGDGSDVVGERLGILFLQPLVPLPEGFGHRSSECLSGLAGNRLSQPVRFGIFYVQTEVSCFLYHASTVLYFRSAGCDFASKI